MTILEKSNAILTEKNSKILAGNIKSGVTIFDVTGTVVELNGETKTVSPSTSQQIITPTTGKNAITQVTVDAVTSAIDANIVANNIKSGVTILGVTGTYDKTLEETTQEYLVDNFDDVTNFCIKYREDETYEYYSFASIPMQCPHLIETSYQSGEYVNGIIIYGITISASIKKGDPANNSTNVTLHIKNTTDTSWGETLLDINLYDSTGTRIGDFAGYANTIGARL